MGVKSISVVCIFFSWHQKKYTVLHWIIVHCEEYKKCVSNVNNIQFSMLNKAAGMVTNLL